MASNEQWYWETERETTGPYPSRIAAIAGVLESQKGTYLYERLLDEFVDVLEANEYTIGRLMPPKTLS